MTAYYNERDPFAAQWLRNLIAAGHIAPGEVDERSITEIAADDLRGFHQCHFFAGIGVWSHALRRAGWADDVSVWTGSCPCQPFSAAGKQQRFDDERHLWPVWFRLIAECRPPVVIGEQVASALDWLDLVSTDLEGTDYAFGAADICAAGFGGAHIRQRFYFMAHAAGERRHRLQGAPGQDGRASPQDGGGIVRLANPLRGGARHDTGEGLGAQAAPDGLHGGIQGQRLRVGLKGASGGVGDTGRLADERWRGSGDVGRSPGEEQGETWEWQRGGDADRGAGIDCWPGAPLLGRNPADWLFCRDGKWRPVEPGTFPLADAAPQRVGRLRAYGNALDAETATEFCGAVADILGLHADERIAA